MLRWRTGLTSIVREFVRDSWDIVAKNLSKTGRSLGWVSAIDSEGRTIWIADAHRDDGKRYVVGADELPTAFMELESVIHPGCELA